MLFVALRAVDSLKTIFTPFLPHTSQLVHELLGYDGLHRGPARVPRGRGGGRPHARDPHRRLPLVGRQLGAERARTGPGAPASRARSSEARRVGRRGRARAHARRRRRVIDTHAHLGDDAAEVLARARAAGVTRVIDGRDDDRAGTRGARARRARGRRLCVPRRAPARGRRVRSTSTSCASCSRTRARSPWGRPGLDYFRDYAPHDAQQRLFDAQLALARELGKPVVIHTRAADDDTRARLVAHDGPVDPALLLVAAAARRRRSSTAGTSRSPATSPTRTRTTCATAAREVPPTCCSPRPTARTSHRSPCAGKRNEPAYVTHTYDVLADAARRATIRAPDRREREAVVRTCMSVAAA